MSYPATMPGNPEESKWYVTPQKKRRRKMVTVTLSDEARERLERLGKARKLSKSEVVEELIMGAPIPGKPDLRILRKSTKSDEGA